MIKYVKLAARRLAVEHLVAEEMSPCSSTDRVPVCGTGDASSILAKGTHIKIVFVIN